MALVGMGGTHLVGAPGLWAPGGASPILRELGGEGYARVAPKLYMGSRPPVGPALGTAFDVLVLCAQEYQPEDGSFGRTKIVRCPIDDAKPTNLEIRKILQAGHEAALHIRAGRRTLVTCHAGLNRSGIVTALALMGNGIHCDRAIEMVRAARGPDALFNSHFVKLLKHLGKMTSAA